MEKSQLLRRMEAGIFADNNGKVLQAVNFGHEKFVKLTGIRYALDMDTADMRECVSFLHDEGYIILRDIATKEDARISDWSFEDLEARVSNKGKRLLQDKIKDDCVNT